MFVFADGSRNDPAVFYVFRVWVGWGHDNVACTCTHVECYATGPGWGGMITFLALVHMLNATQLVWGGGGMITFLALVHMLNATQLVRGGGG